MQKTPKQFAKFINRYVVINAILLAIACAGIYVSFFMNGVNRSFWIDEAFLASSFSKRTFLGILLEGEFDYLQSAPLGWLWFEKLLSILFGNTPYVLRMGSVIAFILILALLSFIQLYLYDSKFPFAAAAFIANTPIVLYYSNMFKPYITDGLVTLIIVATYGLWKRDRISAKALTVIWMCLIWFSQTACFMVGGFLLCEFVFSCFDRDKRAVQKTLIIGSLVVLSFCIYYIVWVRRMASINGMQNYWTDHFFPLIPKSLSDISRGIDLIKSIFKQFDGGYYFVIAFSIGGFMLSVWKKDRTVIGTFLGIGAALFASFLHMYPIYDRLWLFCYPVLALIAFITLEEITLRKPIAEIVAAFVIMVAIMANSGITHYSKASNVYWKGEEVKLEMDYLDDHMKPDDLVYVFSFSKPAFEYYNGYGNNNFGKGTGNVIFGEADFDWRFVFDHALEIKKILSNKNLWIVSSHTVAEEEQFCKLVDAMHENGYLELVYYPYDTPLWHYSKSLSDVKKHFTMDVQTLKKDGDCFEAVICIKNDGEAYLNNPYDDIYLLERKSGKVYPIKELIAPGTEKDIAVRFPENEEPEYVLLSQFGKMSEEDMITITKEMTGEK